MGKEGILKVKEVPQGSWTTPASARFGMIPHVSKGHELSANILVIFLFSS